MNRMRILFFLLITLLILYQYNFVFGENIVGKELKNEFTSTILVKYKNNPHIFKYEYNKDEDILKIVNRFNLQNNVEYAEPNYIYKFSDTIPNDPFYTDQWALEKIKAPQAWDINRGSDNIVIAVLDSGIDIDHPDLINNIWTNTGEIPDNNIDDDNDGYIDDYNGWNFIDSNNDPNPNFTDSWNEEGIHHGTAIAGVIAAEGNNGLGVSGISWESKIMSLRVLSSQGLGDTYTVSQGIDYAVNKGADIINLSFVGSGNSQTLATAINNAYQKGVIIIASAGNENVNLNTNPRYPVCNENVIGVAATDKQDAKWIYSNYGSNCIDISAPGVDIFSTIVYSPSQGFDDYYSSLSGTSLAAPYISGAVSLIKSQFKDLTNSQIQEILLNNADNINENNLDFSGDLGSGRVNLYNSLSETVIPANVANPKKIIIGPGSGMEPLVKVTDKDGKIISNFYAYSKDFKGGVKVASGDVDGDSNDEIITGAGNGGGPQVRIFKQDGQEIKSFFAYDKKFRGGIYVASGDINGDSVDEIVTGAGKRGGPHVRIFDQSGQVINSFFAYDKNFRGGVVVSCGDLDNDGLDEIITGAGAGGGPQVRVFDRYGHTKFTSGFFAYNQNFRGGVYTAIGDLNGDNENEIITGTGYGGGPHVRIFNKYGQPIFNPGFFAYDEKFRGGVVIASGDVDTDGFDEIITGAGPGGGPHIRILDLNGVKEYQFFAYDTTFHGGVFVNSLF